MGKSLVIAEKPSVATDIARALGGFVKKKDYFEGEDYVISSALGHLLKIIVPPKWEVARGKWTFHRLPHLPPHFDLKPIAKTEPKLKLLKCLIKRKDIDCLINACDAGREGELIFRHILWHSKTKKPVKRLWLQSMTQNAIRSGFDHLRDDKDLQPLAHAAVCRSESDWLVGINATRAMTAFNSKSGGFHLTPVGRVQTPTLTILVEREREIKSFKKRSYWEVHATFRAASGTYEGRWLDMQFDKTKRKQDAELRAERIWNLEKAEAIVALCQDKIGIVNEETKPKLEQAPLLFHLTSLQREANHRFGFSAGQTLKIAQALYERHKLITYPRTDARALPEDYLETVAKTIHAFTSSSEPSSSNAFSSYASFAETILKNHWIKPNKRIFNNEKISDHFAIIPTLSSPEKKLNSAESKLYDAIVRRFLAIFYPAAKFEMTTRTTRVEDHVFRTEGKVLVSPGWLVVYGKESQDKNKPHLVPIEMNELVKTIEMEHQKFFTKAPPRYSEATLLSAMEGAGKRVDDEELRAAMGSKGLGTPATRASIIDGLLKENYLIRKDRFLQPTAKAHQLITLLRGLDILELCSPELTGNWEYQLGQIEQGRLEREAFMKKIRSMTEGLVEKAKRFESDTVPGDFDTLKSPCPKCGKGTIRETYRNYQCDTCDLSLRKILSGRQFETREMEQLITHRRLGPFQDFISKKGRPFTAMINLTEEFKVEFDFGENEADETKEKLDFSGKESLGICPKCRARVFDTEFSYLCEKSVGAEKACDFRIRKIILQREMELDQIKKLLTNGKTDLIDRFISKKNGRPFNAFLVLGNDGKIGFEFAPKKSK